MACTQNARWPAKLCKYVADELKYDFDEQENAYRIAHAPHQDLIAVFGARYNLAELNRAAAFVQARAAAARIVFWDMVIDETSAEKLRAQHDLIGRFDQDSLALIEVVTHSGLVTETGFEVIVRAIKQRCAERVRFVDALHGAGTLSV